MPAPDTNLSNLASLKSSPRSRVHTIEVLLGNMPARVQNLAQEMEHTDYIKRINDMTFEANNNLLYIEAEHMDHIKATELAVFRTSITNVEDKMSTHIQLGVMKATQPLSDKTIEPDPNKAATCFLQYEL